MSTLSEPRYQCWEKKRKHDFGGFFISLNPNQQIAVKNLRMFLVSNTSLWFRKQKVLPSLFFAFVVF